jgi:xylulokinase
MKKSDLLLGVDIGTTIVRGLIINVEGKIVADSSLEHNIITPKLGWAEQDPEKDWWEHFIKIVKDLLKKGKIEASNIKGIGVSGSYPDLCPISKDGKPLRNAILYSDNRCINEVKFIKNNYNLDLTSEEILPKLLWFKNHEPEKFKATNMVLSSHNYITYKLTNKYSIDNLSATSLIGLYNGLCEQLGIPPSIIPPKYPAIEIIGKVTKKAAKQTKLKQGIPVIVGTADSFANMLGVGAINKNDCVINYGTAGYCVILHQELEKIAKGKFPLITLLTYLLTTGESLKWFRNNFCQYEKSKFQNNIYQQLDKEAEKVPLGSEGLIFIPYLRGKRTPTYDPKARGIIYGLSIAHTKKHFYRAILESWGYAIRHGLEKFKKDPLKGRIIATGGGAKSKIWRQIVSDIIGKPQIYIENNVALADAFLAGYGIGIFEQFTHIMDWIEIIDITTPDPKNVKEYDKYFKKYNELESDFFNEGEN